MRPNDELLKIIPAELHDIAYCTYHAKQQTWYVYRRDGSVYDPVKRRSIDKRTPLGQIRNNTWSYSPSWLKICEIERLQAERQKDTSPSPAEKRVEAAGKTVSKLREQAQTVSDPRQPLKIHYRLEHILSVLCLAMLGGFTSAASAAAYWKRYHYELKLMFPDLPDTDISHDCFNRILRVVNPDDFLSLMKMFTSAPLKEAARRVFHIDGKAIRASKDKNCKGGRYLLNVYESGMKMLIAQEMVGVKKNEISVVIDVLKKLKIRPGDIFTADAMHLQKNTVAFLTEAGADWCFALKNNQNGLSSEVMRLFAQTDDSRKKIYDSDIECSHDRIETRHTELLPGSMLSKCFKELWPGLAEGSVIMTTTTRQGKSDNSINSCETRYFVSSLSYKPDDAARINAEIIRSHWFIENSLHWVLDLVFNEDRIHAANADYLFNRSLCNKAALNVLRTVQKELRKQGRNISINLLREMCTSPLEALEMLSVYFEATKSQEDVK